MNLNIESRERHWVCELPKLYPVMRYRIKRIDDGVEAILAYSHIVREWHIAELRFEKSRFKGVEDVKRWLNTEYKEKVLDTLKMGIWNSRLRSEVEFLIRSSEVR